MAFSNFVKIAAMPETDPLKADQIHRLMLQKHLSDEQARAIVAPLYKEPSELDKEQQAFEEMNQHMQDYTHPDNAVTSKSQKMTKTAKLRFITEADLLEAAKSVTDKERAEWAQPRDGYPMTNGASRSYVNFKIAAGYDVDDPDGALNEGSVPKQFVTVDAVFAIQGTDQNQAAIILQNTLEGCLLDKGISITRFNVKSVDEQPF
jgi:hypothetical protein